MLDADPARAHACAAYGAARASVQGARRPRPVAGRYPLHLSLLPGLHLFPRLLAAVAGRYPLRLSLPPSPRAPAQGRFGLPQAIHRPLPTPCGYDRKHALLDQAPSPAISGGGWRPCWALGRPLRSKSRSQGAVPRDRPPPCLRPSSPHPSARAYGRARAPPGAALLPCLFSPRRARRPCRSGTGRPGRRRPPSRPLYRVVAREEDTHRDPRPGYGVRLGGGAA